MMTKKYSHEGVTVVWTPEKCIHSEKCAKGLPQVFNPNNRPWIQPEHVSSEVLIEQVNKCPSGALSILNQESIKSDDMSTKIQVMKDGPVLVHGECLVTNSDGSTETKDGVTAFCRCGHSANKPYCDGAHKANGFEA